MSAQSMLEQLLKSGLSMMDANKKSPSNNSLPTGRTGDPGWGKFGAGAATGSVLGLLLGSKRGSSMGGSALKYGSIAALGAVAFKAYNHWQDQQAQQPTQHGNLSPAAGPAQRTPLLPAPGVEEQSQALLRAMIGAAKSDGHLDERERGLIHAELDRIEADPQERQWMEEELRRPLDPAEVARAATTPELAAQMYFASLLMTDDTTFMERAYLDELARQLQLAPGLKAELEAQARAS